MFVKRDTCWSKGQKYCCSTPADLSDCHWVGGSSGNDCANAKCASTELAIDRAQYGDSSSGCDCSRKKVACCTVKKAAREPAKCGADLCSLFPGWCPDDSSDESSVFYRKRNELQSLDKRGIRTPYRVEVGAITVTILSAAYPSIGKLFTVANAADQELRYAFRTNKNYWTSTAMPVITLPAGAISTALLKGLNSEHVIDLRLLLLPTPVTFPHIRFNFVDKQIRTWNLPLM